jgi:hypothetical protein
MSSSSLDQPSSQASTVIESVDTSLSKSEKSDPWLVYFPPGDPDNPLVRFSALFSPLRNVHPSLSCRTGPGGSDGTLPS